MIARFPEARSCAYAPDGIVLGHGGAPASDPCFVEGLFSVQDEASQLVLELLAPAPGERILDTCAAPGTKTAAIAERVGPSGLVVALDRSAPRLALVGRSARRLGLDNVTALARDATQPLADLPGAPFDRILVDAPCSGLGTLRRDPDLKWSRTELDLPRLAAEAGRMLSHAASAVRPGGLLVYATCSSEPEENEAVVSAFLGAHPEFVVERPAPAAGVLRPERVIGADAYLRTLPFRDGLDAFFAAALRRRSPAGL